MREARSQFADVINRAAYARESSYITRHGKRLAEVRPIKEDADLVGKIFADKPQETVSSRVTRHALDVVDNLSQAEKKLASALDDKGKAALSALAEEARRGITDIIQAAALQSTHGLDTPRSLQIDFIRKDGKP